MADGELTNQHPAQEMLQKIMWEMLQEILWKMLREILQEMLWEILQDMVGGVLIRKAVIGGYLAFGMGDGELANQHPIQEIWWEILQEILWEILQEMLWEILWEILREMLWEILWNRVEGKAYLRKAVIGGNLAFGMGDG